MCADPAPIPPLALPSIYVYVRARLADDLKQRVLTASTANLDLAPELAACSSLFEELERLRCPLEDAGLHVRWELLALPQRLVRAIGRAKVLFKQLQAELRAQLHSDINFFTGRVSKAIDAAHAVYAFADLDGAIKHARGATAALEELRRCQEAAPELGRHEDLFGLDPRSDFSHVDTEIVDLTPFAALWQLAADWTNHHEDWMLGELLKLQPGGMRESLAAIHERMVSVEAALLDDDDETEEEEDSSDEAGDDGLKAVDHLTNEGGNKEGGGADRPNASSSSAAASPRQGPGKAGRAPPPPLPPRNEVLVQLEKAVRDFELRMPLIAVLRNPGLRDRHWDQFDRVSGLGYRPSLQQTLGGVLADFDFAPHLEALKEIATVASHESERTCPTSLRASPPCELLLASSSL